MDVYMMYFIVHYYLTNESSNTDGCRLVTTLKAVSLCPSISALTRTSCGVNLATYAHTCIVSLLG